VLNKLSAYLRREKNLLNIFLVYFFLTFTIGYIDFDRRVESFDTSTEYLEQVVKGEFTLPMNARVLIPYLVYSVHRVSHIPLNYTYVLFRFLFFFLAFCLFHIYLKKWFDDKLAMIGTLSMIASLPLMLTNWYCIPTDMPELITFMLGAMWIRDNKYKNLLLLIPIATFNRETTIALALLYLFYNFKREKASILVKKTAILFSLWLLPYLMLLYIFGHLPRGPLFVLLGNVQGLLSMFKTLNPYTHHYFLLYLCGFYWILAFIDFHKKDPFLKSSILVMTIFFLYVFFRGGRINEVRIFIPFYVFVIPLGLFSLFKKEGVAKI